ncbi:hypothetical protein [Phycicoccus sp. Soil803]|uniref:hypothetical protein n=1 Tax=Phycicoccus sp. Soil803 TaxID=1736415 RepID=UPI00070EAB00|nr:hypothetical protein [Phycicoccus sp. Soil803]KRF24271.1 hypothetical protein ASG95_06710 [Phycicoccus sp. Soil803]
MASAHGAGATTHRWPARLVRLAARALPRGPLRERYRQELLADLALVDHRGRFALQVLLQVPHLRRATTAHPTDSPLGDIVAATKPFLCRTNLHHRWELAETSDREEYIRCAKCLKEKWTGLGDDRSVASNVIANYGSIN